MELILDSLKAAVISLEKAVNISRLKNEDKTTDVDEIEVIQAGVIQNFEFTYELCWKFMKRWIEVNIGAAYVDGVPRRELFRQAVENRLIDDVDAWMEFHQARNETSHTYNESVAEYVYATALTFVDHAKGLLEKLESNNDRS